MIDWVRVNELRDEIGAEDFHEVVELFLEEVDEMIDRLATSPDPSQYESDMHFLKGSALNLGFQDFSQLCGDAEQHAAAGDTGLVDVGAVISCYRASRVEFQLQTGTDRAA